MDIRLNNTETWCRALAFAAGAGCLRTAAGSAIKNGAPRDVVYAMAFGVAAVALLLPRIWQRSPLLAFVLLVPVLSAETYGALLSASLIATNLAEKQAPMKAATKRHNSAEKSLNKAETALAGAPEVSERLVAPGVAGGHQLIQGRRTPL